MGGGGGGGGVRGTRAMRLTVWSTIGVLGEAATRNAEAQERKHDPEAKIARNRVVDRATMIFKSRSRAADHVADRSMWTSANCYEKNPVALHENICDIAANNP